MRYLVVFRHGEFSGADLTTKGKSDIGRLTDRLQRLIPRLTSVRVISSPAPRALQSALVLCQILGTSIFQVSSEFLEEHSSSTDARRAQRFIIGVGHTTDIVIVATHLTYTSAITKAYAQKFGHDSEFIPKMGQGALIDIVAETITILN